MVAYELHLCADSCVVAPVPLPICLYVSRADSCCHFAIRVPELNGDRRSLSFRPVRPCRVEGVEFVLHQPRPSCRRRDRVYCLVGIHSNSVFLLSPCGPSALAESAVGVCRPRRRLGFPAFRRQPCSSACPLVHVRELGVALEL